ncbi:MAG: hypothetical protein ABTD50_24495 [Polyangiaceae bacterium]
MVFTLPVPVAAYGARVAWAVGWVLASDAMSERREKALGRYIVAASLLGCVTCAVMVAKGN